MLFDMDSKCKNKYSEKMIKFFDAFLPVPALSPKVAHFRQVLSTW